MKIINGVKHYIAHCFDVENNEKTRVFWTEREFEFAEFLCRVGAMTLIPNKGYFYKFSTLKEAMQKHGGNPYWSFARLNSFSNQSLV